jgi:hypothetical protein
MDYSFILPGFNSLIYRQPTQNNSQLLEGIQVMKAAASLIESMVTRDSPTATLGPRTPQGVSIGALLNGLSHLSNPHAATIDTSGILDEIRSMQQLVLQLHSDVISLLEMQKFMRQDIDRVMGQSQLNLGYRRESSEFDTLRFHVVEHPHLQGLQDMLSQVNMNSMPTENDPIHRNNHTTIAEDAPQTLSTVIAPQASFENACGPESNQ